MKRLRGLLGLLGRVLERLGHVLERLGGVLMRLGGVLGRFLELLGSVLEASWCVLGASYIGRLEVSWGSLGLDFHSLEEPNSEIPSWLVFCTIFLFDFCSKNRSPNLQKS